MTEEDATAVARVCDSPLLTGEPCVPGINVDRVFQPWARHPLPLALMELAWPGLGMGPGLGLGSCRRTATPHNINLLQDGPEHI